MRLNVALISLALLLMIWEPVASIGMSSSSGSSGCVARNAIEAYCVNHGGCPKDGNCYFMDGSYCDLQSFYNGTCPGRAYYEDAIWMAEAYAFLYGDYNPQGQYYVPGVSSSYYNYPYAYAGKEGSYYWPVYAPGYGTAYGTAYGTGYGTGKYTS